MLNGKLVIGVIGVGGIGVSHIKAAAECPNVAGVIACDTDDAVLEKNTADIKCILKTKDWKEVIAREDVDAVIIATPDQIHREMVVASLEAGKHVLCEKPFALHTDDCRAMIDCGKKMGKKIMIGQVCRLTPAFVLAKHIVDSGDIGELFFVESEYAHDYSTMPFHWRNDPVDKRHPVSGGGCHAVDLLRWIAGNPTEAYGYTNKKVLVDWPCDDSAIAVLKFPNNVMGKVFVSTGCKRNYTMRTCIYGTKGTIICDNTSNTLSVFFENFEGKGTLYGSSMKNIEMKIPVTINNHNIRTEVFEFCDIVLNDKEVTIKGEEGASTIAVCEAIIKSAETGVPEKIEYNF